MWEGIIKNKYLEVYIWENDEGVALLGPAALNIICVRDGNIVGISPEKDHENYIVTGKSYLEGIAAEMAYQVENLVEESKIEYDYRIKVVYRASEINITIDEVIMNYIHSNQKKVDIRGPVFVGLSFKVINKVK